MGDGLEVQHGDDLEYNESRGHGFEGGIKRHGPQRYENARVDHVKAIFEGDDSVFERRRRLVRGAPIRGEAVNILNLGGGEHSERKTVLKLMGNHVSDYNRDAYEREVVARRGPRGIGREGAGIFVSFKNSSY